jgi:hypothetical protein
MDDTYSNEAQTLQDLDRPEHLLVWALRAIVLGHGDCPMLKRTFDRVCGPMSGDALITYTAIVKIIAMTGRRRLLVHVPGCAAVSPDEKAIVGVVAIAQSSFRGDETALRAHIAVLLGNEAPQTLIMAAQAVGRILQSRGCLLPYRNAAEDGPSSRPCPTLH